MAMKITAVIMTVYNRREITLRGLHLIHNAIKAMGESYAFDIYMTDDGCNDGTAKAVGKEFPKIKIIHGDGNLYWSGGMRMAWQAAIDSGITYDYYLWFNDDAALYENALITMFSDSQQAGVNAIISGAFCGSDGKTSYGGRNRHNQILKPNGKLQDIFLMNGNLVLIPQKAVTAIGNIDKVYTHSLGDWDYGCRASKNGFRVFLSSVFVGTSCRHDVEDNRCFSNEYPLSFRWKCLNNRKKNIKASLVFNFRRYNPFIALIKFSAPYIYTLFPSLFRLKHPSGVSYNV